MKKQLVLIIAVATLFGFVAEKQREKTVTLTDGQAVATYNLLETVKKLAPVSDVVSAKEATFIVQGADSIQRVIATQYNDTLKNK